GRAGLRAPQRTTQSAFDLIPLVISDLVRCAPGAYALHFRQLLSRLIATSRHATITVWKFGLSTGSSGSGGTCRTATARPPQCGRRAGAALRRPPAAMKP